MANNKNLGFENIFSFEAFKVNIVSKGFCRMVGGGGGRAASRPTFESLRPTGLDLQKCAQPLVI